MRIDILSVLPELLESPLQHSIMKRAQEKGLVEVYVHPLRKWAVNEYGQVDDYQYGGGAGMVMMCEPLAKAIEELSKKIGDQSKAIQGLDTKIDAKTDKLASDISNVSIEVSYLKGLLDAEKLARK